MRKQTLMLILICCMAFGFRMFFAFQADTFDPDAYFNFRQIESISKTGLPLYSDELSYGGRISIFVPLFHYFLGFFSLFLPLSFVLKVIPNLLASSIVIINYLIAKNITKDENASLFCAFISAFIPVFVLETINNISVYSLIIPLGFLSVYFLMNINKERYVYYFLASSIIFILLHASSSIIIIGLLVYALMTRLEDLSQKREEIESILFLSFFLIWINFLIYKKAFLAHGTYVIWRNIPPKILLLYFEQAHIFEGVIKMGLIAIILGGYIFYRYVFREKNREIYMLAGIALTCFFLMWLRLLQPNVAFMFLGTILAILLAKGYKLFFDYLKKTRADKFKIFFIFLFIVIFFVSSVIPLSSFTEQRISESPSKEKIEALEWIKENTDESEVIAASLQEGYMISALAERKNVIDINFILIEEADERYDDIVRIFRSNYKTEVIPLLNKYDITYILFSDAAKDEFNIKRLGYVDEECFNLLFDNEEVKIYESLCQVEEI